MQCIHSRRSCCHRDSTCKLDFQSGQENTGLCQYYAQTVRQATAEPSLVIAGSVHSWALVTLAAVLVTLILMPGILREDSYHGEREFCVAHTAGTAVELQDNSDTAGSSESAEFSNNSTGSTLRENTNTAALDDEVNAENHKNEEITEVYGPSQRRKSRWSWSWFRCMWYRPRKNANADKELPLVSSANMYHCIVLTDLTHRPRLILLEIAHLPILSRGCQPAPLMLGSGFLDRSTSAAGS